MPETCARCGFTPDPRCVNGFFWDKVDGRDYEFACNNLVGLAIDGPARQRIQANAQAAAGNWPIPRRYLPATLGTGDLKLTAAEKQSAYDAHKRALDWFGQLHREGEEGVIGPSMVISGGNGTGKTYLAAALANNAKTRGFGVAFCPAANLVNRLKGAIRSGRTLEDAATEDERTLYAAIQDADLLILDDLGKQFSSDYTDSALWEILEARHSACKPVIVTLNYTSTQIAVNATWRALIDRLKGDGWALTMGGKSLRTGA